MSKKSRKRNKKILAALALAGGAAMLAKGRRKSVSDVGQDAEDINIGTNAPILGTDHITKKVVAPESTGPVLNVTGGVHANKPAKGIMLKQRALTAGNQIPPSMRGGAAQAEGFQRYVAPNRQWPGGYVGRKGGGIAKRGTGVALKSGGRVKSMGIAKRGGGIAKR